MDNTLSLQDAVMYAKNFENFEGVFSAVSLHPEWLITIPENRKWAIIHHVVYSGNIDHLDQLLAFQKANKDFRLLVESRVNETVLDIAQVLDDDKRMFKHLERLVKLDEMLNYAKNSQWDQCYDIVKANPKYGNEKPSYRRYYLIHHLACSNEINQFKRFQEIENFQFHMNLRADREKINTIARKNNAEEFAKYIETNYSSYFDDEDNELYEPSETAKEHTNNVNTLMVQRSISQESDISFGPAANIKTRTEKDKQLQHILLKQQQEKKEQLASQANKSVLQHPIDIIRNLLTCSLTQAIVTDPVIAADGFTYERSAIEKWLKTNDCSPMTNEKLAHKNLNPNILVTSILATITQ